MKWLFVPLGMLLGWAWFETLRFSPILLVLAALAFEYLAYQARYTWNDLRDVIVDQSEPGRAEDRIPPGGEEAAAASMLLRTIAFGLVIVAAWQSIGPGLLAGGVGIMAAAIPYEYARSASASADGWTDRPGTWDLAVYVLVGAGYALRVVFGVWLVAGASAPLPLIAGIAVAAWALGISFVTATWCIYSGAFVRFPEMPADVAVRYAPGVLEKPHFMPLLRWSGVFDGIVPARDEPAPAAPGPDQERARLRSGSSIPLLAASPGRWWAPWNSGAVFSAVALAAVVVALDLATGQVEQWWLLAVLISGVLSALLAATVPLLWAWSGAVASIAVLAAGAATLAVAPRTLSAVVALAPAMILLIFRGMSHDDLRRSLRETLKLAGEQVGALSLALARLVTPRPRGV